jgi:hypothetical protein
MYVITKFYLKPILNVRAEVQVISAHKQKILFHLLAVNGATNHEEHVDQSDPQGVSCSVYAVKHGLQLR